MISSTITLSRVKKKKRNVTYTKIEKKMWRNGSCAALLLQPKFRLRFSIIRVCVSIDPWVGIKSSA